MPTWNGDPRDFEQEYNSVFEHATELSNIDIPVDDVRSEIVGATIKFPEISAEDMDFDTRMTMAAAEAKEKEAIAKRIQREQDEQDEQIDREWEHASVGVLTFADAVTNANEITSITTTAHTGDADTWITIDASTRLWSSNMEDDEDIDYITVSEFKDFIYDLIEEKGGALPDLNDWKRIKNMLDQMPEDYPEDYDDDEGYYGSNEDSILVGEAEEPVNLYHNGTCKVTTTVNGIEIKNPSIGDIFLNTDNQSFITWNGTKWEDESYRG